MAQKPGTARNNSGMERVGKRKLGYNVSQVNAFLERAHTLYESEDTRLTQQDIQDVSFDLERNGYVIGQVDAALSRLERAVVDKCTEREIAQYGRVVWKARVEDTYRKLLQHAQRDYRDRFDSGLSRRPSYARKQVDIMVDQALDKIAFMLGHEPEWETDEDTLRDIDAEYVSNVIFTQKTGKHGYDERQVDYYLNACIRLLSSLESFERVEQYVDADISSYTPASFVANPQPKPQSQPQSQLQPQSVEPQMQAASANNFEAAHADFAQSAVAPSFSPAIKSALVNNGNVDSASSASSVSSEDSADVVNNSQAPDALPKITRAQSVPRVPDHDKQSIFAPVDYNNQTSSDSFESLHQSERAIFTPHTSANKPSNALDDADSNDELLQSATVMQNTTNPAVIPPSFAPTYHRNVVKPADTESSASAIPSFPPAAPANRTSLPNPPMPIMHLEPSKPLNLDIPDLSFPVMGHVDESNDFNDDDSDDDTSDSNRL